MNCERPNGCRTPYGCAGIQRCWWNDRRAVRRRLPRLPSAAPNWKDPNRPEPGYWMIKLVRNGPLVPACVRMTETTHEPGNESNDMTGTRSPQLAAFILDEPASLDRVWTAVKHAYIDEKEYQYRVELARWAKQHSPEEAAAQPRKPIDLLREPPPF